MRRGNLFFVCLLLMTLLIGLPGLSAQEETETPLAPPSLTATNTPTATASPTASATATVTNTATATLTATDSATLTATSSPTVTASSSATATIAAELTAEMTEIATEPIAEVTESATEPGIELVEVTESIIEPVIEVTAELTESVTTITQTAPAPIIPSTIIVPIMPGALETSNSLNNIIISAHSTPYLNSALFVRSGDIWRLDLDNCTLTTCPETRLTNLGDIYDVAWSPDRTQIAFVRDDPVSSDIAGIPYIMPTPTSPTAIAEAITYRYVHDGIAWSNDGTMIAIGSEGKIRVIEYSNCTGTVGPICGGTIFPFSFSQPNVVDITNPNGAGRPHGYPAWSPDDALIYYTNNVFEDGNPNKSLDSALLMYSGDVLGVTLSEIISDQVFDVSTPTVSPDGNLIAFVAGGELWIYDATTQIIKSVYTGGISSIWSPSWSNSGTELGFYTTSNNNVYVLSDIIEDTNDYTATVSQRTSTVLGYSQFVWGNPIAAHSSHCQMTIDASLGVSFHNDPTNPGSGGNIPLGTQLNVDYNYNGNEWYFVRWGIEEGWLWFSQFDPAWYTISGDCSGLTTHPDFIPTPTPTPTLTPTITPTPLPNMNVAPEAMALWQNAEIFGLLPEPINIMPYDTQLDPPPSPELGFTLWSQGYGPTTRSFQRRSTDYTATNRIHTGLDYGGLTTGVCESGVTSGCTWVNRWIVSLCDGVVIQAKTNGGSAGIGYGVTIQCFSGDTDGNGTPYLSNIIMSYNHLTQNRLVSVNDQVQRGDRIGTTIEWPSARGGVINTHVHLEIFIADTYSTHIISGGTAISGQSLRINPLLLFTQERVTQHQNASGFQNYYPDRLSAEQPPNIHGISSTDLDEWFIQGELYSGSANFWTSQDNTVAGVETSGYITDLNSYLLNIYLSTPYDPQICQVC